MFDVKKEAISTISKYFGIQASELYELHYKNKQEEVILASLEKLLKDFIGDEKTAVEMGRFYKNKNN
jgi:hypothetical protein